MPPRAGGARRVHAGGAAAPAPAGPSASDAPEAAAPAGYDALCLAVPVLDAAAAQLLGQMDASSRLTVERLDEVEALLTDGRLCGVHAARVLSNRVLMTALLRLAAAAVHTSPEQCWGARQRPDEAWAAVPGAARGVGLLPAAARVACRGAALLSRLCLDGIADPCAVLSVLGTCRALLRMRVLHASARQLAAAAALLRPGQPLPVQAGVQDLRVPWATCMSLLCLLVGPASYVHSLGAGTGHAGHRAAALELCGQLAGALRSSCVLEHAAQGLVVLAARPECSPPLLAEVGCMVQLLFASLMAGSMPGSQPCGPAGPAAALADLSAALRPPRVQHLVAVGAVLALRDADGGPVYGLDTGLYGRLYPAGDSWALNGLRSSTALWWLAALTAHEQPAPGVLPRHGWCCVMLRLAAAAAARWARAEAEWRPPDASRNALAITAHRSMAYLSEQLSCGALREQQRREAWRLLLRVSDCEVAACARRGHAQPSGEHAGLLRAFAASVDPDEPGSCGAEPAIAAGVVPFLERLLRQGWSAAAPAAPASAAMAARLLSGLPLAPLLTHGSPRECAALAVTLRKVLRRSSPDYLCCRGAHLQDAGPPTAVLCAASIVLQHVRHTALQAAGAPCGQAAAAEVEVEEPAAARGVTAVPRPLPRPTAWQLLCQALVWPLMLVVNAWELCCWALRVLVRGAQADARGRQQHHQQHHQQQNQQNRHQQHRLHHQRQQRLLSPAAAPPHAVWLHLTLAVLELLPELAAALLRSQQRVPRTAAAAAAGSKEAWCSLRHLACEYSWVQEWCLWLLSQCTAPPFHGDEASVGTDGSGGGSGGSGGGGGWRDFLLHRVRVVELVGASLHFHAQALRGLERGVLVQPPQQLHTAVCLALGVARVFPQDARAALRRHDCGGGAAWPVTELLCYIHDHCTRDTFVFAIVLSRLVGDWAAGNEVHVDVLEPQPAPPLPLAPVAEARSLLRTCSNPGCTHLQGDSEAGVALSMCARCGGVWYCGQACQLAHWRAGHKAECGAGQGTGGGQDG